MGVFERVLEGREAPAAVDMPVHQAVATIVVAAVSADGHVSPEEAARVNEVFATTRLFQHAPEPLQGMLDTVTQLMSTYGAGTLVPAAARAIPAELRGPVFAVAVDLVLADGQAGPGERSFIDRLQGQLAIPDELAAQVVQVLLLKNGL